MYPVCRFELRRI